MKDSELKKLKYLAQKYIEQRDYKIPLTLTELQQDIAMSAVIGSVQMEVEVLQELLQKFILDYGNGVFDNWFQLISYFDEKVRVRHISFSEVSSFKRCKLQHALSYKLRLERKDSDRSYLQIGSWTHWLIEQLYAIGYDASEADIEYLFDRLENEKVINEVGENVRMNAEIAKMMLWVYWKTVFQTEQDSFRMSPENTEKFLKARLRTKSGRISSLYQYLGYADGIFDGVDGKKYLHEIKTKATYDNSQKALLALDDQITGYIWLGRENGIDMAGVIYTILLKPRIYRRKVKGYNLLDANGNILDSVRLKSEAISLSKEIGNDVVIELFEREESDEEIIHRLWQAVKSEPEKYIVREVLFRTDEQIRLWQKKYLDYAKACVKNDIDKAYPEPADPYNNYCGMCDFYEVCQHWHDEVTRNEIIKELYVTPEEKALAEAESQNVLEELDF